MRDTIVIGLESVPGATVEAACGPAAIERARRRKFDAVFVRHEPRDPVNGNGLEVLARLREFDAEAEAVLVMDGRLPKISSAERDLYHVAAILKTPIEPNDFFRLAVRLRNRKSAPRPKNERAPA